MTRKKRRVSLFTKQPKVALYITFGGRGSGKIAFIKQWEDDLQSDNKPVRIYPGMKMQGVQQSSEFFREGIITVSYPNGLWPNRGNPEQ